jgi:hypothetical protein
VLHTIVSDVASDVLFVLCVYLIHVFKSCVSNFVLVVGEV